MELDREHMVDVGVELVSQEKRVQVKQVVLLGEDTLMGNYLYKDFLLGVDGCHL